MPRVPTMPAAMPMAPATNRLPRPSGSYTFATFSLPRTTVARSVVRTWDEIHRLEWELVLADARGAAHRVRDRTHHCDGSELAQCSGLVVCGDQRDVDLRHLVETQVVSGVEVRLGRAAAHDVDPTVQEIADAEDRATFDLAVDGAGIDDDARIRDDGDSVDRDLSSG